MDYNVGMSGPFCERVLSNALSHSFLRLPAENVEVLSNIRAARQGAKAFVPILIKSQVQGSALLRRGQSHRHNRYLAASPYASGGTARKCCPVMKQPPEKTLS